MLPLCPRRGDAEKLRGAKPREPASTSMHVAQILLALALAAILGAVYCWYQARQHLSPEGQKHPLQVYLMGVFARRQQFTEQGWRYFNWYTILCFVGMFITLAVAFLVGW